VFADETDDLHTARFVPKLKEAQEGRNGYLSFRTARFLRSEESAFPCLPSPSPASASRTCSAIPFYPDEGRAGWPLPPVIRELGGPAEVSSRQYRHPLFSIGCVTF